MKQIRNLLTVALLLTAVCMQAQEDSSDGELRLLERDIDAGYYPYDVNLKATFPLGDPSVWAQKHLRKNVLNDEPLNVIACFVVEPDGSFSEIGFRDCYYDVERTLTPMDVSDGVYDELMRLTKSMPKWKPAKENGKPVRSRGRFTVDIKGNDKGAVVDFLLVDERPEFDNLYKWIDANARPLNLSETKRAVVEVIVEKDGSLSSPKILRTISKEADAEILRLLKIMPKWKPGKRRGQVVRVKMQFPISLRH